MGWADTCWALPTRGLLSFGLHTHHPEETSSPQIFLWGPAERTLIMTFPWTRVHVPGTMLLGGIQGSGLVTLQCKQCQDRGKSRGWTGGWGAREAFL